MSFWSRWRPLCLRSWCVWMLGGWDDGNSTWDDGGLCGCSEGEDAWLRLALLILCHHVDLILCIPVQAAQHHILTAVGKADLWFPVRYMLLRKKCGGDKTHNCVTYETDINQNLQKGLCRWFENNPIVTVIILSFLELPFFKGICSIMFNSNISILL